MHTDSTSLHLAFSTYLFDPDGRLLITRRALSKKIWPGVWSNSACGHVMRGQTSDGAGSSRLTSQ
ncbi:MAG: NUDIX domain-containing protein [Trueperella sp.]|nr:NUDIX domain-containing protein [Trueperella sp.]